VIATAILGACRSNDETPYDLIYEEQDAPLHKRQYDYVEIEGIYRRIMPQGSLFIEHFLEDLDYMIYVLENNFALLDVAHWAHGAYYRELAAAARESVLAMEEPCEAMLLAIVYWHFYPLYGTGHFDIFTPWRFSSVINNFYGGYRGQKALMNLRLMQSPLADRFYGSETIAENFIAAIWQIAEFYEPTYNRMWGYITGNGAERIGHDIIIEIIEEGCIAYLFPGANMQVMHSGQGQIFNFYRQISNFEHLIIDLRGNGGGNIGFFLDTIVKPNLTEAVEAPHTFRFFSGRAICAQIWRQTVFINNLWRVSYKFRALSSGPRGFGSA